MAQSKIAVITGGTGALGSAIVSKLLSDGFRCHVTWLVERELGHFAYAEKVSLHQVDCADEAQTTAFYAKLERVDASVHIVGGFAMAGLTDTSLADFDKMFRLNAVTAFLCTREAVRNMRRTGPGRIVNVAARPALIPAGGSIAYSTSKAAVASLTQCCAEEVRSEGILINAIVPSIMDTPMNRTSMPSSDFSKWPKVEEVAETVGYLVSDKNTLTTACLLPVFGRNP